MTLEPAAAVSTPSRVLIVVTTAARDERFLHEDDVVAIEIR